MAKNTRAIKNLFETVSLGAPENSIGFVLWRVAVRYQREVDRALQPFNLTNLQFMTLAIAAWLGQTGDEVTQTALARFGDIQPMQVSLMLKTLESKGMVARPRSTSDERARRVEATAAGLKALSLAFPIMIDIQRRLFGEEGRVGGSLLTALLAIDSKRTDEAV